VHRTGEWLPFPAIAGTWIGIEQSGQLFGGVLMARVSLIVSIGLALAASVLYALSSSIPKYEFSWGMLHRTGAPAWTLVFGIATLNLLACIGGWLIRANVEAHFVKQDNPEWEDLEI
jgi:hypothetical protein